MNKIKTFFKMATVLLIVCPLAALVVGPYQAVTDKTPVWADKLADALFEWGLSHEQG